MRWRYLIALFLGAAAGCGKPTLYPVSGEVRIDAIPAANVTVRFSPESLGHGTPGSRIGIGITGPDGRFKITTANAEKGLERGSYHVTFSRAVVRGKTIGSERPDGAVESIPMPYSDHQNPGNSPVTASVPSSTDFVFDVPLKK
jgi:hypothetical protein